MIKSNILALTGDFLFGFSRESIQITRIIGVSGGRIRLVLAPEGGFAHLVSEWLERV